MVLHRILHRADLAEDVGADIEDPAAHVHDLQREGDCRRDGSRRECAVVPAGERQPGDRDHQPGVEHEQHAPHIGEDAHQLLELHRVFQHRVRHILVLVPGGREGLERVDIGVGIDDAAGQITERASDRAPNIWR